ncbi:MAG: AAA family ATPase [Flavobacteriales bacterium]|nr:AAA family ATPase [Flavobacteriales bacterium]
MRLSYAENIYQYFKTFCDEFIIQGNSILSDTPNVLNTTTLQNCFTNYVENFKEGGDSFGAKIKTQFTNADLPTKLVFAHAEWLWGFAVNDISVWRKKEQTKRTTGLSDQDLKDIYPDGFGSAGMYHKNNKYYEIKFVLYLIEFLFQKAQENENITADELSNWTEAFCLYHKYGQEFDQYIIPEETKKNIPDWSLATSNILLYVSKPDKYERIASDTHKRDIVNGFKGLLDVTDEIKEKTTDEKIFLIREKLTSLVNRPGFDFYEDQFKRVWNYSLTQEGFSEVQGLQYKKAIILYGPPGTSKTHTAKRLSRAIIEDQFLSSPENVKKYFEENIDIASERIHRLQLHTNYTYEDFIAGYQLVNNETKVTKGKLFEICEKAINDHLPHVLILDEINRVDLSRLFGEVFSALEDRDQPIDLSIGGLKLTIPNNLYVIGTMNEIDFSLEQIDFALRRRFLWFPYGFNEGVLREIIWHKNQHLNTRLKPEEVDKYISNCIALNKHLKNLPELGPQYEIGHTFFGEIVNIYKSFKDITGSSRLRYQIFRNDGAIDIIWSISIEPIISAFLGNLDKETKEAKLKELRSIFRK